MAPEHIRPQLSVIVIIYNMERAAKRTLYSLCTDYQRDVQAADYEVIVMDNGSDVPMDEGFFAHLAGNFRYEYLADAPPSPVKAINRGFDLARGDMVAVMIDGARMVTPGIVAATISAGRAYTSPVVTTVGWLLGHEIQSRAIAKGVYDEQVEDQLLASIRWPEDGYRLYDISVVMGSNAGAWFGRMMETNYLALRTADWARIGYADERFDFPGGGLLSFDMYKEAVELKGSTFVMLLDDATFHQIHGGIASNSTHDDLLTNLRKWRKQYIAIRGQDFETPTRRPLLWGQVRQNLLPHLSEQIQIAMANNFQCPYTWYWSEYSGE